VNFAFDEDQEALRATVRRFLEDKSAEADVRRLMETDDGYDRDVWHQMASQLGLQGIAVPEEFGGAGFGFVELTVVFEEMGRRLLCAPYFSTVAMAVPLLLALGDTEANDEYLPKIAAGSLIAAVALAEPAGSWDPAALTVVATQADQGWTITGEKHYVIDGHVADVVFVIASTTEGLSVFAVDRDASGLAVELASTMDKTRKLSRLSFEATPARLIGREGDASAAVARMLDLAAVALAAEQVGGAQRALEIAVDYAKLREQFGRKIGSFQAIKHKCANMLLGVESAKSAAYYAGWAVAEDDPELPVLASVAKSYCSDVYVQVAGENIQIHGGIGFTWEHPAHLYFKRAKSSALLLGSPEDHRARLLERLGL
jgi:alkylation response protein AidB-like acyl-CoA dehydrogenase